jgi:hypothetical protein
MASGLAPGAVLLARKSEGDKGDKIEIGVRAGEGVNPGGAVPKADVADAEKVVDAPGNPGVLPRPEEEVESDGRAGGGGSASEGAVRNGQGPGGADELDRNRADPRGWGVLPGPGTKEGGKTDVQGAMRVQPRVDGPQAGERLAHRAYGVFHCPRSDRVAAGREVAVAVAMGKEEEKREPIGDVWEVGIEAQAATKGRPEMPCGVLGGAAVVRDAGTRRRHNSAPVTAESIVGGGGDMRQEAVCG